MLDEFDATLSKAGGSTSGKLGLAEQRVLARHSIREVLGFDVVQHVHGVLESLWQYVGETSGAKYHRCTKSVQEISSLAQNRACHSRNRNIRKTWHEFLPRV